ncbi:ser thr protein phosphatase family [Stylonychia lemnae]|uniref:Ser thr protein phosphatase family n=1 Tax=Stylonychia lemnae TaxID=5949 RepID=A0A078B2S0_STYLE|nr:ser thr protein phosphatase family [Stylonychia lemnae]|eukprot:CDW87517.1 ser thr protein phosphatase family [Stylonychia lemnae]
MKQVHFTKESRWQKFLMLSMLMYHALDFGVKKLEDLISKTSRSQWIISNLIDEATNKPPGGVQEYAIVQHQGKKVGVIGLAEKEFIDQFTTLVTEKIVYIDCAEKSRDLCRILKEEHQCDLVIALTHLRIPNERILAQTVPELDLLLGGHDHLYHIEMVADVFFLKSGTDFEDFSDLVIRFDVSEEDAKKYLELDNVNSKRYLYSKTKKLLFECERVTIDERFAADNYIHDHVIKYSQKFNEDLNVPCGYTEVNLEGRFQCIRVEETNLSNLLADIIRTEYDVDFSLFNCGTYRSNSVLEKGYITHKMIMDLLPMADKVVVVKMLGSTFKQALENGVSAFPKFDGRFPSISGCRFSFDPTKEPLHRINLEDVETESGPLDSTKEYKVAMKGFLASGKDGYIMFRDGGITQFLIEDENAVLIQDVMYQFFESFGPDNDKNHVIKDRIRAERLKLFNASEDNVTKEGFIKIHPVCDERIVNLQQIQQNLEEVGKIQEENQEKFQ